MDIKITQKGVDEILYLDYFQKGSVAEI